MRFDKNYAKVYQNIYMDISDILVTDIDFFSREGLKDENKELRVRLMKLARMNRELIVERNETMSHFEELNDKVETLNIELSKEVVKNSNLNKKLSGIAW
jgi:predicted nuclease with TOPRIM domain